MLLNTRSAQTSKTVDLKRAYPGKELFLRQLVDTAGLLDCDPAGTDRSDTAALRRTTHLLVFGGGKISMIGIPLSGSSDCLFIVRQDSAERPFPQS
jgi:hypothetical protein